MLERSRYIKIDSAIFVEESRIFDRLEFIVKFQVREVLGSASLETLDLLEIELGMDKIIFQYITRINELEKVQDM